MQVPQLQNSHRAQAPLKSFMCITHSGRASMCPHGIFLGCMKGQQEPCISVCVVKAELAGGRQIGRSATIISLLASHQQFIPSVEKALQYNGVNLC